LIHFKKLRYKNILSTGNAWTELQLDSHDTTLIVGDNGAGKSTMLDALSFVLYGKPFRKINKPQLLNSINQKDLVVEVEFAVGGKNYLVKRGIKPSIFEIWSNDKLLNQDAAARDYQAFLEDNILKLNYKSFGQVVVLGSSTFVPFMQLPAKSRRDVIEDLLDIQIFTTMNTLLKDRVSINKENLAEIKYTIDLTKNKIDSAKTHTESIRELKESQIKKIKSKLKEQIGYVEKEETEINKLSDEVDDLLSKITDKEKMEKKFSEINDLMRDLENKKRTLTKNLTFYNNHDNCPTCKQGIEHDFKSSVLTDSNDKIVNIEDAKNQLSNKSEGVEARLSEISGIESSISTISMKISEHRANKKMAMNACKSLQKELVEAERDIETVDDETIKAFENDLKKSMEQQKELTEEREVLATVGAMLKDGGIKTRIIKQYVPIMNKLINKYLAAMDFFVQFELDESFNETIKSRFRDAFSYSSFSEGEKARLDLSLLLTWRAISRLRNSVATNLLILDEVFDGSLDNNGISDLVKILGDLSGESNIFIISHKGDQIQDKFENVIKFKKHKGFSTKEDVFV
jgi:DNA repair exonuclease SbcCD ATPase subunit